MWGYIYLREEEGGWVGGVHAILTGQPLTLLRNLPDPETGGADQQGVNNMGKSSVGAFSAEL